MACTGTMLAQMAQRFRMAMLVTNHVVSAGGHFNFGSSGGAGSGGGTGAGPSAPPGYKPALGEQWRSRPHTRVQLSRGDGAQRLAMLTASTQQVRVGA